MATADHRVTSDSHRPLRALASFAEWDIQLAAKIREYGIAVQEESVIEELLSD